MNKKKYIIIGIVVIIVAICGIGAFYILNFDKKLVRAVEKSMLPGVVCIGDSLTHGTGGEGIAYPAYLKDLMETDKIHIPVVNMGIGGENTVTIAGRIGGIPYTVSSFTIPAEIQRTPIFLLDNNLHPLIKGLDTGINPCSIAGVEGRLSYDEDEKQYYFEREEAGSSLEVSDGTEIIPYAKEAYKDYIYVLFMGENGGFDDIDDLIAQQEAVLKTQCANSDKFIVIGLTTGTAESRQELENALSEKWGEHYINIREYFSSEAVYKAGVDISDSDLDEMKKGMVPKCLRTDDIHYNEAGYRQLAQIVYDRLIELGYFDDFESIKWLEH